MLTRMTRWLAGSHIIHTLSLITIPVPIVCVFQGCVISSCWYFAQALLRILITACLISLFFSADWALWSAGDRRRHVFYFGNRAALGRNLNRLFFSVGRSGGAGRGADHLIFRRTEGGIIRNWEPKKEIIAEELEELRRTTYIRLRAVCLFFCRPSSKTRDTQMATRVTDSARRERHVSRVSRLRRSSARALLSLNLKKKRDCSQSRLTCVGQCQFESI